MPKVEHPVQRKPPLSSEAEREGYAASNNSANVASSALHSLAHLLARQAAAEYVAQQEPERPQ